MVCVGPAPVFSLQYRELCAQMLPHTQVWTTVNGNRPKVTVTTQEVSPSYLLVSFHIVSPCSETTLYALYLLVCCEAVVVRIMISVTFPRKFFSLSHPIREPEILGAHESSQSELSEDGTVQSEYVTTASSVLTLQPCDAS